MINPRKIIRASALPLLIALIFSGCSSTKKATEGGGGTGGSGKGTIQGTAVIPSTAQSRNLTKTNPIHILAGIFGVRKAHALSNIEPMADATCKLQTLASDGTYSDVSGVAAVTTDASGNFTFSDVPNASNYVVTCTKASGASTITLRSITSVAGDTVQTSVNAESTIAVELVKDKASSLTQAATAFNEDEILDLIDIILNILNSGFESLGISIQTIIDALLSDAGLDTLAGIIDNVSAVDSLLGELDTTEDEAAEGSGLSAAVPGSCVSEGTIVFVSDADTASGELYLASSAGTPTHRLTSNRARETNPHFSHDGCLVCYTSDKSGDTSKTATDIWTINLDTGTETNLTSSFTNDSDDESNEDWCNFSPDGDKVTFQSDKAGNVDVWTASSTDGSSSTNLTSGNPCFDGEPDWHRDTANTPTEKIAFAKVPDTDSMTTTDCEATELSGEEVTDVYIMSTDGSSQTEVASNSSSGPSRQPEFATGSTKLAYWLGPAPGEIKVLTFDASWAVSSEIDHTPFPDCSHPSQTPDTTEIVYESNETDGLTIDKVQADGTSTAFCSCSTETIIDLGLASFDPDVYKD